MAKNEKPAAEETAVALNGPTEVQVEGRTLSTQDLIDDLAKSEVGQEVTNEYYEFPDGVEERCVLLLHTKIKGQQGQEVPAVRLLLSDGSVVVNAAAVITSTLMNYKPGAKFSITKIGEKKAAAGGKYHAFRIHELM